MNKKKSSESLEHKKFIPKNESLVIEKRNLLQRLKEKFFTLKIHKKPEKKKEKMLRKEKIPTRKKFSIWIEKAGISASREKISRILFNICLFIVFIFSGYLIFRSVINEDSLTYIFVMMILLWTLGFLGLLLILWLSFFLIVDYRIYLRKVGIEDVFPDFLQLTSANIRAGMPIDQALWHAIRPNFGVLAKEMEDVAKQTMSGTDLEKALYEFAEKYDSTLLKRSISLLIEGLNAGGEIGELLDRIATNIQESKMMQKEMASSVTTYAIFITFASLLAAPFLLALSGQLLVIIEKIISSIDLPKTTATLPISFSKVSVKPSDFKIFAGMTLAITSLLSASIVAIIRKGSIKAGIRYLPIFLVSALILYFLLDKILGVALAGIF